MDNKKDLTTEERLQARADYVAQFVNSNSQKGIGVHHSIKTLCNHVLFISEKTGANSSGVLLLLPR